MGVPMPTATAPIIAKAIIAFCNNHGDLISNLKLQKLLYYAQGWHLALYNRPLFTDPMEAWVHGPVQPDVYKAFKAFGTGPIIHDPGALTVSKHVANHIADVMEAYGSIPAFELERHTHREKPWQLARNNAAPDEPSHGVISLSDLKAFFRERLNEQKK